MRTIKTHQTDGGGYYVWFRHPHTRKPTKATLQTTDENTARTIAHHLTTFANNADQYPLTDDALASAGQFHSRAVEIWFGRPAPARDVTPFDAMRDALTTESPEWRAHFERFDQYEKEIPTLRARARELEAENDRLRRAAGIHTRTTLHTAFAAWKNEYKRTHARRTGKEAVKAVDSFKNHVGRKLIGQIKRRDVQSWIGAQSTRPATKRKNRAYLSTFFSWCRHRYDLTENPVSDVPVPGLTRNPGTIHALSHSTLMDICAALEPWGYWRALFLTGTLAGPRWDELRRLRVDHVCIETRTLHILSVKTGRQRQTPIERTMLLPVLQSHLPDKGYVFPSAVRPGTKPRTQTPAGMWSDSSTFLRAWRRVVKKAWVKDDKPCPTDWTLGPRYWRHTAGSALGHCGYSSLQISQWLGNSEAVARAHYIPPVSSTHWGLQW